MLTVKKKFLPFSKVAKVAVPKICVATLTDLQSESVGRVPPQPGRQVRGCRPVVAGEEAVPGEPETEKCFLASDQSDLNSLAETELCLL